MWIKYVCKEKEILSRGQSYPKANRYEIIKFGEGL
jgi:hypothetical protein